MGVCMCMNKNDFQEIQFLILFRSLSHSLSSFQGETILWFQVIKKLRLVMGAFRKALLPIDVKVC